MPSESVVTLTPPRDFEARYGYRPWLVESFVDVSQVAGTCFRAANWIRVGQTRGRGRQDRFQQAAETVKDIYVYPLEPAFRVHLGLPADGSRGPLGPAEGLEAAHWAEQEFGGAPLGDRRLSARLVQSAGAQAQRPGRAVSGVAKGDWPAVKGYYRLIDHPDESAVSPANILRPHRDQTVRRMQGQRLVLCVHDGSDLDYTGLAACVGLGVIGTNQTGVQSRGLHLHSTLAVTPEGLPLGVLRAECTAPPAQSSAENSPTSAIPIEEKETFAWIAAHRECVAVAPEMPQTRLISVMDREADFFELFDEQRRQPRVDLLVRAKHNRPSAGNPGSCSLPSARRRSRRGCRSRSRAGAPGRSGRSRKPGPSARPARPRSRCGPRPCSSGPGRTTGTKRRSPSGCSMRWKSTRRRGPRRWSGSC